ncbi:hypothetical protein HID58_087351 [Brassica napus]|uniref:Uncharacterized protein n=1 Tax=Brassica napus TaxID=3708 RepID=A0ABQ7XT21_BRANA|nr:hypothetical protein HID58_087351 [Brassica napus]
MTRHGQSHNCELLQILLCPTDLPSISRFRRFLLGLTIAAVKMAVLAWLKGGDWSMVNREWFGQDEWAQRAIDTSHVEAASNENGIGFVKLMDVTVHFVSNGKGGLLEFIEKRIKVNGHKVIVLAEEAERELMCKSMESNRRL